MYTLEALQHILFDVPGDCEVSEEENDSDNEGDKIIVRDDDNDRDLDYPAELHIVCAPAPLMCNFLK